MAGDALAAVFNPNLAAWSHSPFATEVEQRLVREIGALFGWPREIVEGTFTAGGMEANHSALLAALTEQFPAFRGQGLRGLTADPVFYVSAECHHSFHRAARMCGLGTVGVRAVPVDERLRLDPAELERMIAGDRSQGRAPFLVVGTAGTTNAGAIDPLAEIGAVARRHRLWFHVDAAWAGAAALVPELRSLLAGVERADSVTVDAHKWLSAPMGAGLFLTQRKGSLERAFTEANPYMPREAGEAGGVDQYQLGMQWSRRFFGLKLWLSLLVRLGGLPLGGAADDGAGDASRNRFAPKGLARAQFHAAADRVFHGRVGRSGRAGADSRRSVPLRRGLDLDDQVARRPRRITGLRDEFPHHRGRYRPLARLP